LTIGNRRGILRTITLLIASAAGFGASFETGIVAASDGAAHWTNAYPVIVRIAGGRMVTAFSVLPKDNPDGYIAASTSDDGGKTWSPAVKALDIAGKLDADPSLLWDGRRVYVYSTTVPLKQTLIESSQMYVATSTAGDRWTEPQEIVLPFAYSVGKRHMVVPLLDGSYAMPISWDLWAQRGTPARTEGEMDLASGVLKSRNGMDWRVFGALHTNARKVTPSSTGGVCEPALVELRNGELYMLLRTGTNFLYESRSYDNGVTWTEPRPSPLVSHNTPAALWRLEDRPDEIAAIWNHSPLTRYPLSVAISADGGKTWSAPRDVAISDGPQVSYPNLTQATDGALLAVWQAQRKEGGRDIRWARFSREWVLGK
jgi:BNR repeat-like domain